MIISDLNYLEVVAEETSIQGGDAVAQALSTAQAFGPNYAQADTATGTLAITIAQANLAQSASGSLSQSF